MRVCDFSQAGPEGERMLAGDHKDRRQWNGGHQTWFQQRQRALQAGWRCAARITKDALALKTPWLTGWLLQPGLPWERAPVNWSSDLLWSCRIVTDGEKRDVWRLTVENVSACMKPEEKEKEQNMYRDVSPSMSVWRRRRENVLCCSGSGQWRYPCVQLYSRHKDYLSSLVGQDFEMVSPRLLCLAKLYLCNMCLPTISSAASCWCSALPHERRDRWAALISADWAYFFKCPSSVNLLYLIFSSLSSQSLPRDLNMITYTYTSSWSFPPVRPLKQESLRNSAKTSQNLCNDIGKLTLTCTVGTLIHRLVQPAFSLSLGGHPYLPDQNVAQGTFGVLSAVSVSVKLLMLISPLFVYSHKKTGRCGFLQFPLQLWGLLHVWKGEWGWEWAVKNYYY